MRIQYDGKMYQVKDAQIKGLASDYFVLQLSNNKELKVKRSEDEFQALVIESGKLDDLIKQLKQPKKKSSPKSPLLDKTSEFDKLKESK